MRLSNLCVSKEWAEKLKKAGFPQDNTLAYFIDEDDDDDFVLATKSEWETISSEWGDSSLVEEHKNFAAPTAEEILCEFTDFYENGLKRTIKKYSEEIFVDFYIEYGRIPGESLFFSRVYSGTDGTNFYNGGKIVKFDKLELPFYRDKSLVNALAPMYIYLKTDKPFLGKK